MNIPAHVRTILRPGAVVTTNVWPAQARRVHVLCIGGAGMSAVARLALEAGCTVSGSDAQEGQFLPPLREAGARVYVGFAREQLPTDADVVVVSTAVRPDNPEVLAAREAGIPVVHRATALAGLIGERETIAVAGTHGKTTTTAMSVMALRGCGEDPAFAVGAAVADLGRNAALGENCAVIEADESDGSFLAYRPRVVLVTNQEADHLDFYETAENVTAAFQALVAGMGSDGVLVACADDPGARALAEAAPCRTVLYGNAEDADWRISDVTTAAAGARARISHARHGELVLELAVTGAHNVLNAVGALAACVELGRDVTGLLAGLSRFHGASRRFELKGEVSGVSVYDDYAHHPNELQATLSSARQVAGEGRVIAVFQPHLFSRTKAFAAEFAQALSLADTALVLDVYAAREDLDESVNAETIVREYTGGDERVRTAGPREQLPGEVAALAHPGDIVLLLGAGDIVAESPRVLAALGARD
ncbi:UDP-N-acetylmuramate--L-alanine ligase [Dermabacteraceae bacterium P13115]